MYRCLEFFSLIFLFRILKFPKENARSAAFRSSLAHSRAQPLKITVCFPLLKGHFIPKPHYDWNYFIIKNSLVKTCWAGLETEWVTRNTTTE